MSTSKRKSHRKHFKVESLKSRETVDKMLAEGYTYEDIVAAVAKNGESITAASLSRYHGSFERIAERITKTREQMKVLVEAVREQPNTDLAQVANELMMTGLIQRISTAEDEFDDLPLDKVGRLVASLERSGIMREKLKFEFDKGVSAAHAEYKSRVQDELKAHPELLLRMLEIIDNVQEELTTD
ncbi:hypothetical protein AJ85_05715 [Alkalihalobacillus alcalophilus ATCC 27647 = CGMCC 1.3604]|uniref:Uncharacterized protein n=1 Tax=Alkalihalobacillus alcalophilus ATCC 27647 = CGMCC 1.3604 TaxID=1218173 RepID=A0A094XDK6_ALKAL|nr:phage protein Gp27 family protein [Alkalihalobacillus alcalophilus]YP_009276828.1 DUF3486 family protein [Bacillus phage BalMu-1]AJA42400.1 hypothetical protein BalMu1_B22 [Bacillus phage BalMu-1]AJA42456.1 hypothetical protein BalMu1_A22 [Bacillus phage BalMu-1]KGA96855.1 hypothetical protein BALCAV_0213635 [Alkalihalobacillus alcalophilus ATCC 27647 = CGMCC 1.3604]MED1561144.1 DUF3486 family protein [Alkalihalobacillus alcalophilus]THG91320.1 hypothetical protein AJ85_05715 [Alkalihaloba